MVATVSHNDIAASIHCDSPGQVELSIGLFSVSIALFTSACQSVHLTLWYDHTDTMVCKVSHDNIAALI
jgi:hypothetical protein